jgi:hypothetical protein
MAKIQSITLARLVNLGDYEQERYEFTVGVNEGEDPGAVFVLAHELLKDMAERPPYNEYSICEARRIIDRLKSTPQEVADKQRVLDAVDAYNRRKAGIAERLRGLGGFSHMGTGGINALAAMEEANWRSLMGHGPITAKELQAWQRP